VFILSLRIDSRVRGREMAERRIYGRDKHSPLQTSAEANTETSGTPSPLANTTKTPLSALTTHIKPPLGPLSLKDL
jgi:hypothetical protein